jgi:hypothetical protein
MLSCIRDRYVLLFLCAVRHPVYIQKRIYSSLATPISTAHTISRQHRTALLYNPYDSTHIIDKRHCFLKTLVILDQYLLRINTTKSSLSLI